MNIVLDDRRDEVRLATIDGKVGLVMSTALARELLVSLENVLPSMTHEDVEALFDAHFDVAEVTSGRTCSLGCHEPIVDRETYSEVRGYVRTQRKGGGANQVALRKPTGRIAHARCIEDAKKGGTGQQGML